MTELAQLREDVAAIKARGARLVLLAPPCLRPAMRWLTGAIDRLMAADLRRTERMHEKRKEARR